MRTSQYPLFTVKETPAEAEIISHQLMLRAGMIRKLASGIYDWMPLGLRVLRKVEAIVREEMNRSGAIELLMPAIQPADLWKESGRWEVYDDELLRIQDRHERDFCVGPTHEEVITDIARREIRSYKQLPLNFYQIQTKFRDETRPRFGVMRAREFIMKDAYSFHANAESLEQTYQLMYDTYHRIFERLGLGFKAVEADSGNIGGNQSHEFHVLADSGEDAIAWSPETGYAANVERAPTFASGQRPEPNADLETVPTPGMSSCEEVTTALGLPLAQSVKLLAFLNAGEDELIAVAIRGDHQLNEIKAQQIPDIHPQLKMAPETMLKQRFNAGAGSIGPIGYEGKVYADFAAGEVSDFVCGANIDGHHFRGANWRRDCAEPTAMDLREAQAGDPTPYGKGKLELVRGIEVGHVFQLGDKYTKALGANVIAENGKETAMQMGCYGIGVSRIVASAIEQNHDDRGILWPASIAPFQVAIVALNWKKSERVREQCEALYTQLQAAGVDVLLDDRDLRPGVKLADIELIGIPHRIVVGDRGLDNGELEYRYRREPDNQMIAIDEIGSFIEKALSQV